MSSDPRIYKIKKIDQTGWEIVFTVDHRYFFHDTFEGESVWRPPGNLYDYLIELSEERLEELFDADRIEVDLYYSDDDVDSSNGMVDSSSTNVSKPTLQNRDLSNEACCITTSTPPRTKKARKLSDSEMEAFKEYLLEQTDLNPFEPWSQIYAKLQRGQPNANERQLKEAFQEISPTLVRIQRERRSELVKDANEKWMACLQSLTLDSPHTWTEYSLEVKRCAWFPLLDARRLEKEYREKIKNLHESQDNVYLIPKSAMNNR